MNTSKKKSEPRSKATSHDVLIAKTLEYLKNQSGRAVKQRRIARVLNIPAAGYVTYRHLLKEMVEQGLIEQCSRNSFRLPARPHQVQGTISFSGKGFAFVSTADNEDMYIAAENVGTAFHHDQVLIERLRRRKGLNPEGRVLQVVQRSTEPLLGTARRQGAQWFVFTEQPTRKVSIIPDRNSNKLQEGQLVELGGILWDRPFQVPLAKIRQILGKLDEPRDDIAIIIKTFRVRQDFPRQVLEQAGQLKVGVRDFEGRLDLTNKVIFTIDPETAMDYDDAVSLEPGGNGNWLIGVHIADVSHFIPADSALDREARRRGTSIYCGPHVIPMLPEQLANHLCSLQPDETRLTYSVLMNVDATGILLNYQIIPSFIRSVRRFTYEEVQDILNQKRGSHYEILAAMRGLSTILYQKRVSAGSIDFDLPEPFFRMGEDEVPLEIKPSTRLDSHRLIEEFMLLANRTVAEHIAIKRQRDRLPFIYRIHARPTDQDIEKLYEILKYLGLNYVRPQQFTPAVLQRILNDIRDLPYSNFIERIAVRSMTKALYSSLPLGHFGLAFRHYTHFTSPIRRYPDLLAHRLLRLYSQTGTFEIAPGLRRSLSAIAKSASESEIKAMEIEREYIKIKQIRYLTRQIGKWFSGVISGVTEFGFFVEISQFLVEGLVHIRKLEDDFYIYDADRHCLKGRRWGRVFRLGDVVQVRIAAVSITDRSVDLDWGE